MLSRPNWRRTPNWLRRCRKLRRVTGQLEQWYAAEPTPPLDAQRRRVIASGDGPAERSNQDAADTIRREASTSWRIPGLVLATAAALLLLIGVPVWMKTESPLTVTQMSEVSPPNGSADRSVESEMIAEESLAEVEEQSSDMPSRSIAGDRLRKRDDFVGRSSTAAERLSERTPRRTGGSESVAAGPRPAIEAKAAAPPEPAAPALGTRRQSERRSLSRPSPFGDAAPAPAISQAPADEGLELAMSGTGREAKDASGTDANAEFEFTPESGKGVVRGTMTNIPYPEKSSEDGRLEANDVYSSDMPEDLEARFAEADVADDMSAAMGMRSPTPGIRESVRQRSSPAMPAPASSSRAKRGQVANKPDGDVDFDSRQSGALRGRGVGGGAMGGGADFGLPVDEGRGPGIAGDRFEPITDNPFKRVSEHPLSTFSVDVDTASYSKTRDFLMRANQLPRPDAVRIEELINYFDYDYDPPSADRRASVRGSRDRHRLPVERGTPFGPHRLERQDDGQGRTTGVQPGLPARHQRFDERAEQAAAGDRRNADAAQATRMRRTTWRSPSTPDRPAWCSIQHSAKKSKKIRNALTQLSAGGSTNGGAGIALAYQTARDHFIPEGVNRVILCTDGDFNVGTTGTDELVRMVEQEAKGGIFLSVLGFGMGNHNDAMLEKISGRGNGNYAFIDNRKEARKVLVDQTSGTLVTIAKDVKLQVEFNPDQVSSYRLIGYENRVLAKEDFNDDKKDAGEIGAGHAVTALVRNRSRRCRSGCRVPEGG